jgi:type IV pilus assembly protein PilM
MGLFGKKKSDSSGLIGVDIGAGGIKCVELTPESGRLRLHTYGFSEEKNPGANNESLLENPKRAAGVLTEIIKKAGIKSGVANASLRSHEVFHAIITVPQPRSEKEDIKPMIETQVKKVLPQPINEMILDSTVIDTDLMPKSRKDKKEAKKDGEKKKEKPLTAHERKHIRVLVSGAPKKMVQGYIETFKIAKIDLIALETEAFALIRSLIGKDKSRIMIVDIGYNRTNITIVHDGIPFLHRSIQAGGVDMTNAISQQMGIDMHEAEQTKRDFAMAEESDEVPAVFQKAMQPILHELKYSLQLYAQQDFHVHQNVEKIIITGGSAALPQIRPFLSGELNMNVYLGNPWARIGIPEGIEPVLQENGPRFSVAIGLAMKKH